MVFIQSLLCVVIDAWFLNLVIENSGIRPRFSPTFIFATADDVTIPVSTKRSQGSLLRFTQASGKEKDSINSFDVSSEETEKSANANNEKQRPISWNVTNHELKNGIRYHVSQSSMRVHNNVRKVEKRRKKKLPHDTTQSTRNRGRKDRRTLHHNAYLRSNSEINMHSEKNDSPITAEKEMKENIINPSNTAAGIRYIPNFDTMTCVEYRMIPSYFPPEFFSLNSQDCCRTYFAEIAVECMMHSSTGFKGGGSFNVVDGSSESGFGWGGSFWMGNIGKASKSAAKSGKSAGKSGKSFGKSGKLAGKSGKSWRWVNIAWGNQYEVARSVPTELPTYLGAGTEGYQTNTPMVTSPAQTASIPSPLPTPSLSAFPTTYIPTYNPTYLSTESFQPEISPNPTNFAAHPGITPIPTLAAITPYPIGRLPPVEFKPTMKPTHVPDRHQAKASKRTPKPTSRPTPKPSIKLSPKPTSKLSQKDTYKPTGDGRGACNIDRFSVCCQGEFAINVPGDLPKKCKKWDCNCP